MGNPRVLEGEHPPTKLQISANINSFGDPPEEQKHTHTHTHSPCSRSDSGPRAAGRELRHLEQELPEVLRPPVDLPPAYVGSTGIQRVQLSFPLGAKFDQKPGNHQLPVGKEAQLLKPNGEHNTSTSKPLNHQTKPPTRGKVKQDAQVFLSCPNAPAHTLCSRPRIK